MLLLIVNRARDSKPLTLQELKELNARIKSFEEMARMEDRLKALESRKRPRSELSSSALPPEEPTAGLPPSNRGSRDPSSHYNHPTAIRPLIEQDDLDSSSSNTVVHPCKRWRFTRGIKVTLSYTLKVSSSLREWGDWKKDMERVFRGDPYTYQTGS